MLKRYAKILRRLAPLGLVILAIALTASTQSLGVHTSSGVSIRAGARNVALWYYDLPRQGASLRTPAAIAKYWQKNAADGDLTGGQPPMARIVFSVAHLISTKYAVHLLHWILALLFGAVVWMTIRLGSHWINDQVGLLAGALLLLMPGALYSARSVGPEAVSVFTSTLLVYAYSRSQRSRVWALATPLVFAMACLSAAEGILLFIPLAIAGFVLRRPAPSRSDDAGRLPLPQIWLTPLWMVAVGLGLVIALWPVLWADPKLTLLNELVQTFKSAHPSTRLFGESPANGTTLPFFTTTWLLVTKLPLPVAGFALYGFVLLLKVARPHDGGVLAMSRSAIVAPLVLSCWWVIHSVNGSPYYAGQDLLAPYLPLLSLCAAVGVVAAYRQILVWPRFRWYHRRGQRALAAVLLLLALGSALLAQLRSFPYEAAYFNVLANGVRPLNAENLSFPMATLPLPVVTAVNRLCPGSLSIAPATPRLSALAQRLSKSGLLAPSLSASNQAACLLVFHNQSIVPATVSGTWHAVARFGLWGAPLFTLHKAGR